MGEPDSQKFNNSSEYLAAETAVPKFIKKKKWLMMIWILNNDRKP